MIDFTPIDRITWVLTEEGKQLAKDGSHEARVFQAIPAGDEGLPIAELQVMPLCIWVYKHVLTLYIFRTRLVLLLSLVKVRPSRTSGCPRRALTWSVWLIALLMRPKRIWRKLSLLVHSRTPRSLPTWRRELWLTSSMTHLFVFNRADTQFYLFYIESWLLTLYQRVLTSLWKSRRRLLTLHLKWSNRKLFYCVCVNRY